MCVRVWAFCRLRAAHELTTEFSSAIAQRGRHVAVREDGKVSGGGVQCVLVLYSYAVSLTSRAREARQSREKLAQSKAARAARRHATTSPRCCSFSVPPLAGPIRRPGDANISCCNSRLRRSAPRRAARTRASANLAPLAELVSPARVVSQARELSRSCHRSAHPALASETRKAWAEEAQGWTDGPPCVTALEPCSTPATRERPFPLSVLVSLAISICSPE